MSIVPREWNKAYTNVNSDRQCLYSIVGVVDLSTVKLSTRQINWIPNEWTQAHATRIRFCEVGSRIGVIDGGTIWYALLGVVKPDERRHTDTGSLDRSLVGGVRDSTAVDRSDITDLGIVEPCIAEDTITCLIDSSGIVGERYDIA